MKPNGRLLLAAALAGAWLGLLLAGNAFGGAVHLLVPAALVAIPWRLPAGREAGAKELS